MNNIKRPESARNQIASRCAGFEAAERLYLTTNQQLATAPSLLVDLLIEDGLQAEAVLAGVVADEQTAPTKLCYKLLLAISPDGVRFDDGVAVVEAAGSPPLYKVGNVTDRSKFGKIMRLKLIYYSTDGTTVAARFSVHGSVTYVGQ